MILWIFCALCSTVVLCEGQHTCPKPGNDNECCENYYPVNGTCVACPDGWYAENCTEKCPKNMYANEIEVKFRQFSELLVTFRRINGSDIISTIESRAERDEDIEKDPVLSEDDILIITCPYFTKLAWMVRLMTLMHLKGLDAESEP
uniref:Uncharacterized protein n=1 Tax=Magallana gigas TaxID=29159 RepID=K1QVL3_MAGGI